MPNDEMLDDLPDDQAGDESRRERGQRIWREVMAFDALPATEPYTEVTVDTVFAELWDRPGISRRDRRLISLTVCAMSAQPIAMGAHVSAALSSGDLSVEELDEWVLQLSFYGGWPVGSSAYAAVRAAAAAQT
jgi:4-carboxymuconolactone decarboxylase